MARKSHWTRKPSVMPRKTPPKNLLQNEEEIAEGPEAAPEEKAPKGANLGIETKPQSHEPRRSSHWQIWRCAQAAIWIRIGSIIAALEERGKSRWGDGTVGVYFETTQHGLS